MKASGEDKDTSKFSDDELLTVYSLYKQGTVGNCNTEKPGFLDFKGKAKWEAWNKLQGVSQEQAKQQYVDFANTSFVKHNVPKYVVQ